LGQPINVRNKYNISIINALWTIIAGKRYNLVNIKKTFLFLMLWIKERARAKLGVTIKGRVRVRGESER
jgi:hypothetical protein